MNSNKRGPRRKTLRFKDHPDTQEEVENMSKTEKQETSAVKEEISQKVEALNVAESPMMEQMIERTGGDDFLFKDQPQNNSQQAASENTPPVQQEQIKTQETTTQQTNQPVQPQPIAGGPKEFAFNPVTQNSQSGPGDSPSDTPPTNEIPPEISDESSKMIAEMLLEGFGMIAPEMADRYSKLNEGHIRKLERDNKIDPGLVEIAKNVNKNNKNAVKVTNEQKNLIRKPLIKVLEVQGVKASPETMLVIAIVAVCVMLFIQARGIKRGNDDMVKSWMEDHSRSKKLATENDTLKSKIREYEEALNRKEEKIGDNVPYAEVTEV